jgi:O-antigen/teichoic acid export membrane protein
MPEAGDPAHQVLRAEGRRRGSVTRLASTTYLATMFGIVTGPITARVLGAEGRGEYAAVMIYSSTATVILSLGMGFTVSHALLTLRADPRMVYGNILRFCGLLLIPSLILAGAAVTLMSDFSDAARLGTLVFIVLAPLGVLQICLNAFLMSEGALGPLTLARVLPLFLNVVGVVLLALTGTLTVASYLVLTFIGTVGAAALTVGLVKLRPNSGGRLGPQFRFGLRAYPGSLAGIANSQLDQLMVAPLLGARDLGYYAVAVTLANLPLGVVQALSARSIRDISGPEGGGLDIVRAAHNLRQAVVIATIAVTGLAVVTPLLVPLLYGRSFGATAGLCLVLLPGTIAVTVSVIAGPALSLAGRPGSASMAQLVALGFTAVGLAVTLPVLGVMGAAITTTLAYGVRAGLQLWALRREGVTDLVPRWQDVREVVGMLAHKLTSQIARLARLIRSSANRNG